MSFANKWLRYLESQEGKLIYGVGLEGKRYENMPFNDIHVSGTIAMQSFKHRKGMTIPDQIKVKPTPVKIVKIETSEGNTYLIAKVKGGNNMVIRHVKSQRELSPEEETELKREAKKRGYNVVDVIQTDV